MFTDGRVRFDRDHIQNGQGVCQSLVGGQEIGSIWGHGAYVAPDWTADYLHREATFVLDRWAQNMGAKDYASLPEEQQATLRAQLEKEFRMNTYDPATRHVMVSPTRAEAFDALNSYDADVFGEGRDEYAVISRVHRSTTVPYHQLDTRAIDKL